MESRAVFAMMQFPQSAHLQPFAEEHASEVIAGDICMKSENLDKFRRNAFVVAIATTVVAVVVKFCVDALPDAAVALGFMRPAARLAAFYLGVAFDASTMTLAARGVEIEVVRACSATDFFAMAFALLALAMPVRRLALRIPASIAVAWCVVVLANAVRFVLLIYADGFFPSSQIPAVHMSIGIAVFLSVFVMLWYAFVIRKEIPHGNNAAE